MKQTLFISYSWTDSNTADEIDTIFQPTGIFVKRDIRAIKFKGSIKKYMSEIRETDFVLILISDSFIKSSNCMYEMLELLKEQDYQKKILPVLIDGTKIFTPKEKIEYIKYWGDKYIELETDLKTVNTTDALELYKELKHIENIRSSIDEFLGIISDENFLSFSKLKVQKFKPIFDYIGVSDRFLLKKLFSLGSIKTVEEKEIELDKIESEFPNNSKVYAAKAINAFNEKKIQNSIYFYRKSIELDPTFATSYRIRTHKYKSI
ncbi:MAG: toll/interleukin-1 receptor domain-containing protein [Ginsengibacter sp.]